MTDQQRPQGLLKFQVHHWKQDNISDEEFAKWYTEEFIPRSVKILKTYGVEQYKLDVFTDLTTQKILTPSSIRSVFQADLDQHKNKPGWTVADYDATSSYLISDPRILQNALSDPEYQQLEQWASKWADTSRGVLQVGTEYTFIDAKEVVNTELKDLCLELDSEKPIHILL